jgi:hypothetical protein
MKHQILGKTFLNLLCRYNEGGFFFSKNNYRSSQKIDSGGRPVKGRGFMVL